MSFLNRILNCPDRNGTATTRRRRAWARAAFAGVSAARDFHPRPQRPVAENHYPAFFRRKLWTVVAGVLAFAPAANSTDFFFKPSVGNWSDANNWSTDTGPAGLPMAADNVEFRGVNNTYVVTASGNAIHDIRVEAANLTLNLSGSLTASGSLFGYLFGNPQTFGARSVSITGSGTFSADSIQATAFTIASGATVKTTNGFTTVSLNATGATLNTGAFVGQASQISGGSMITSTSADVSSAFGPSTLDASRWTVSGLFQSTNAYTLTIKNGGTLTSGSALTSQSGGVLVDGGGSSWKITNDATIRSTSGLSAGMEVEHGGVVTVGGNLFIADGGTAYGNYASTTGPSEIDVTGKVDLSSAGSIYLGQGATITSAGVVTRATPFTGGSIPNGATLDISGTWTNTGGFVIGESGQSTASTGDGLTVRGMLTTSADLIVGQSAAFNTLLVGTGGTVTNVNGVLAQNAGSKTTASVTGTWANSGTLTVADAGTATLSIGNSSGAGGTVTNTAATVGNQASANGSVDIAGAGKWTVNGNLVVGAAGMSVGKVSAGFGGTLAVTGATITLGRDAGSTGMLSLDNAFAHGTLFNFTGEILVGLAGSGTLEILDGFQLDHGAKSLTLGGQATAQGTLRVSDDYAQFGFPAATPTFYKSTNLTIGSLGQGALDIEHNGFVQTTGDAVVGEMAGGSGIASIAGTGSKWQVDGSLVIGKSGSASASATGQVIVMGGGTLTVNGPLVTLGQETGSKGTLTIDGVGSTFSNPSKLEIGRHGDGTLEVKNGASIILPSTTLGTQADGHGTITVDGKGANNGPASSVTTNGSLTIGGVNGSSSKAGGDLNITGGGQMVIDGGEAIVGRDAGSRGGVHLAGQGSQWLINAPGGSLGGPTPGNLTIGQGGLGHVGITDHATLTTAALVLARDADSFGTLDLTGSGGTNDARLTVNGELQAGVGSFARVTVSAGARLSITDKLLVATGSGSTGEVHFQGAGTTAMIGNQLTVGKGGLGSVSVESGAMLTTRIGYIGALTLGGTGSGSLTIDGAGGASGAQFETLNISNPVGALSGSGVQVTGTGAHLAATVALNIGTGFGTTPGTGQFVLGPGGTVTVAEVNVASDIGTSFITIGGDAARAATLTTPQLNIGGANGGQATVTVDAGGRIDASAVGQTVRVNQSGQLTVESSGASVAAHDLLIDRGTFMLINNASTEVGSTFSLTGGGSGAGSATVADSGRLSVENSAIVDAGASLSVHDSGSVAIHDELRISHGGSVSVFHNGTMTQTDIQVGSASSGSGTLTASDGGHLDAIALSIGGGSVVSVSGGGNILLSPTQAQAAAGTVTVAAGGALTNNGTINGVVVAQSGGTIGGAGTINGLVILNAGGTLAPGNSPGTITVGALTVGSGSILNYQLGTPGVVGGGVNDLTIVNGALTLSGGTLNVADAGGFGAGTYRLFNYAGTLTGGSLSFGAVPAGFTASDFMLQTSVANQINLIVSSGTPVPMQYWNGANTMPTAGVLGGTGNWNNTTTNWTDATGAASANWQQGVAIFSAGSGTATLGENIAATELRFLPGSGAYTVTTGPNTLTINGAGISNTSGLTQSFVTGAGGEGSGGAIIFANRATAGSATVFTANGGTASGGLGGRVRFNDTANAGAASFTVNGGTAANANGATVDFFNTSTAASGSFTNNGGTVGGTIGNTTRGGSTTFHDTATAGSATFTNNAVTVLAAGAGGTFFRDSSTAGTGNITNKGGVLFNFINGGGGLTLFANTATAGSATITNNAATVGAAGGGETDFFNTATAGSSVITSKGGIASSGQGGRTFFNDSATAGTASLTSEGGTGSGAEGGRIAFVGTASADHGTFTNHGGTANGAAGGTTEFFETSTAGSGTFTNNAGTVSGAGGGETRLRGNSSAGNATLIANGAAIGNGVLYEGGGIYFFDDSTGGTARVIVSGNGKLDISGHSAPGVTVGSIEGSGNVALGARNLAVGSSNASAVFSGVIADGGESGGTGGSLTKIGAGTLTLTGASTYTGSTNVSGGTLAVTGSIASPVVNVNPGGTLGGTGTVAGLVQNSGIVKPGNSPGTLSIGGNYTQFANGTLQIAIAGALPGQFSVLAVGGHAALAGTLQIVRENGAVLKAGDTLKILTAVGGVTGAFSTVSNPFATGSLLGVQVTYEPNDVLLTFTQNTFTQLATLSSAFTGVTPNQIAVAQALDRILADPRAASTIAFLNSESLGAVLADLDKISPEEFTAIFQLAKSLANIQTANVQRRLEEIRSEAASSAGGIAPAGSVTGADGGAHGPEGARGKAVAPAPEERLGLWFTGSGEFTRVGSTTNAAGFSLDSGGVTAGVDYRFTDHFAAGISLGYMNTTASLANGGKIDVDGGRVGAYATYFNRGLHLDAAVSGGPNSYATRRTTPNNTVATGSPEGTEVNLLFAAGYDWKWKGVTLGPVASFQYTNVQLNGFTERGAFAPLSIAAQNADSARSALGFHATFDAKIGRALLRPEVRAAWQHEFGDTSYSLTSSFATLGGAAFTVAGPATGRDSLLVGAGFSIQWNERFSTTFFYDGELLRSNYSSNNVSVGFRYRF